MKSHSFRVARFLLVPALVITAAFSAVPGPLRAEPYRSAGECRVCHRQAFKEWSSSAHARAWSNPAFQARFRAMGKPAECAACHASLPVNETGLDRRPVARRRNRKEGIHCITCHSSGPVVNGPRGMKRNGLSCGNRAMKTPMICAPCHSASCRCFTRFKGLHNRQVGQWSRSPYRFERSCQGCHMPERLRRVANIRQPEIPARTAHSHEFPGSDDADFIRRAIEFKVHRQGDELLLTLINAGAGHDLPASEGRSIVVRAVFLDDSNLELDHRVAFLDRPHHSAIPSGGSRVLSWRLYEGWRRVKISILFRHDPAQPERHWLLLHHRIFDLQRDFRPPPTSPIADRLRLEIKRRAKLRERLKKPTIVDEWGRRHDQ